MTLFPCSPKPLGGLSNLLGIISIGEEEKSCRENFPFFHLDKIKYILWNKLRHKTFIKVIIKKKKKCICWVLNSRHPNCSANNLIPTAKTLVTSHRTIIITIQNKFYTGRRDRLLRVSPRKIKNHHILNITFRSLFISICDCTHSFFFFFFFFLFF